MSKLFYQDLRALVEFASDNGRSDLARPVSDILEALEKSRITDHRDMWEYGSDEPIHPLRRKMTELARAHRAAEDELAKEREKSTPPKPRYTKQVFVIDPQYASYWHRDLSLHELNTAIWITETLANRDELDTYLHYWGQGIAADDQRRSIIYYIKSIGDGRALVCETGGGYVMLKRNLIVTIDEWNTMRETLTVPEHWLHDA